MTNQEFTKSKIYKDIGDYKNMTLLALSKKLPYWRRIYLQTLNGEYSKINHLRNYCRDCDKEEMFTIKMYLTEYGNKKPWTRLNEKFWKSYKENFIKLYSEALEYYRETSKANEEVRCPCGGHYQATNKAKHFKTQRHLSFDILTTVNQRV
jgi:hypothetical protein